jgi:hypothetical protein
MGAGAGPWRCEWDAGAFPDRGMCGSPSGHAGRIPAKAAGASQAEPCRDRHSSRSVSVGNDAFLARRNARLALHGPCRAADAFRPSLPTPTWLSDAGHIRPRRQPPTATARHGIVLIGSIALISPAFITTYRTPSGDMAACDVSAPLSGKLRAHARRSLRRAAADGADRAPNRERTTLLRAG